MARSKSDPKEARDRVRAYLAALPGDRRKHLTKIREAVRAAAPRAVEAFSYGIPAFRLDDAPLVWYASWTGHSSMYPISAAMAGTHGIDLTGYETAKGTVRFPLTEPVPTTLVKRLVKARVADLRKKRKT
jgi:uncharacterized protein YdhG (YjbR/CyaY superfamily)